MSTEFPYLNDTQFPGLRSVDAFRSSSRFDYTRWGVGTTLGLCNVNFCGDYENVVKFADDAVRDAYFDGVIAEELRLDTELRILPNGSIKLPLAFDEAVRYNYLMADFSTATSDERPLPFETRDHVRRFYFFIKDATYVAPNCTECFLHLDEWTTYINRVTINYMMLERGHAPMASITPEQFLSDPIANNSLLLADDVSFGEPVIASKSDFVPFGAGKKYVLIATTVPFEKLSDLGSTNAIQPSDPGYYDTGERNGDGVGLIGPEFAAGDIDYSGLNLYTGTANTGAGSIANNLTVFAVSSDAVYLGGFFDAVVAAIPQLMQTIRAMFVVDESMVTLDNGSPFLTRRTMTWRELAETGSTWQEIANLGVSYARLDANAGEYFGKVSSFTIYSVEPNNGIMSSIHLSVADFGYPDRYKGVAKLYTFPYAALEVSDGDNVATVRVEETSSLNIQQRVSIAYPYIKFESFLEGIGAGGADIFEWRDLRGSEQQASVPRGSFRDTIFAYDIPAFSLFMSGYDDYRLHNYNENNVVALNDAKTSYANSAYSANNAANNAIASADVAYQNANGSAGTAQQNANANASASYANAVNSANVALANAQRQAAVTLANAQRSNATAQQNANAGADSTLASSLATNANAQQNANAGALTSQQNAIRSANMGPTNVQNSNAAATRNTELAVAANTANNSTNNETQTNITGYNNGLMQANQAWDAGYARTMNDYEAATQAITSVTSGASSLGSALVGAATSANPAAGAASIAGAGISAVANVVNTAVNVGFSVAKTEAGISNSQAKVGESQQNALDNVTAQASASTVITSRNNELATAQTKNLTDASYANSVNERSVSVQNAQNTYANAAANAQRARTTSDDNANRSHSTTIANAQRTRTASDANASESNATAVANANANNDASLANAKRSLDVTTASANRTAATARGNASNTQIVTASNAEASRAQSIGNARRELSTKMANARAAYLDRKLDAPVEIGTASGDPTSDEMRTRGLQVRILTQTAGAIAQAGDQMLRFGYALNQSWVGSDLIPMPHFTYWKAADLWLTGGEGVIEHAQETIKNIMRRGVTVWRDADEIGKVSIYDNIS